MNISAIIPTYKNPAYLDLCLKSAIENSVLDTTEIVVVVDGFVEMAAPVLEKYKHKKLMVLELPENGGLGNAINMGVYNASNEYMFIVNEDNVFPKKWDLRMVTRPVAELLREGNIVTISQIEPDQSIFDFHMMDFGRTTETFQYDKFLEYEALLSGERMYNGEHTTPRSGRVFPFVISKKDYMSVGGWDLWFKSPYWVDCDMWLKLELIKPGKFVQYNALNLYHFGGRSTKMGPEGQKWNDSERVGMQQFMYKWGYVPNIMANTKLGNTKLPPETDVRGIHFWDKPLDK